MRIFILIFILIFSGCIVKGPKYTRVEKVLQLRVGMTYNEVSTVLSLKPYDIKSIDSAGTRVLLYKYRLSDRRTVPLFLKDTNGQRIGSGIHNLYCTFSVNDTLIKLKTKSSDSELKEQRLNINTLLTFITVTAPAFLVYLGITQ